MAQAVTPSPQASSSPGHRIADVLWRRKWFVIGVLTAVTIGGGFYARIANGPLEKTAAEQFSEALENLDRFPEARAIRRAKKLAAALEKQDYQDPDFAGGVEFILGTIAFHESQTGTEVSRGQKLELAVKHLARAERISVPLSRRGEWAYLMGVSLHELQRPSARAILMLCARKLPAADDRLAEVNYRICETGIADPTADHLTESLRLNTELMHQSPDVAFRERLRKQRIELLVLSNRSREAADLLGQLSDTESPVVIVLRARVLLAQDKPREAAVLLKPMARVGGITNNNSRTATLLYGVALEKNKELPAALDDYLQLVRNQPSYPQGIAAAIRAGDLLRDAGRNEESLAAYDSALKHVGEIADYQNRWMPLNELRKRVLAAWEAWNKRNLFEEAYRLAEMMKTIVSREDQLRYLANTAQQHAAWAHAQWLRSPPTQKSELERTAYFKWRTSGKAHAALGERIVDRAAAMDAIWKSAEHYRQGHAFQEALKQYNRVIAEDKTERLPLAMIRRSATYSALGNHAQAESDLRAVMEKHRRSPVVFEARLRLGRCLLDQNKVAAARSEWEALLSDPQLAPNASEWREALLALGRSTYLRNGILTNLQTLDPAAKSEDDAIDQLQEAGLRFEKFVRRYPDEPSVVEARYFFARSLMQRAEILRTRRDAATTQNRIRKLTTEVQSTLSHAIGELLAVQKDLSRFSKGSTERTRTIGKSAWHLIAQCRFLQDDYEKAVSAYGDAIHNDPQSSAVVLSYAQMSRCYLGLNRPADAKSMLDQAEIILKQLPESAFEGRGRLLSRADWKTWLIFARESVEAARGKPTTP